MKKVLIYAVSEVKTEKERKDGKNQRQYFSVQFKDASNPFAPARTRNFFQSYDAQGNCVWKGVSRADISALIGTTVDGRFASFNVEPYEIAGRMVSTYSTVILPHEEINLTATLKQLGHAPAKVATPAVNEKAEA